MREYAEDKKTDLVYVPGGWAFDNLRGTARVHPSRQQVINWISEAWSSILPDTIVKLFLHCGISNTKDGSQDDELLDHFPLDEAETRQEAASLLSVTLNQIPSLKVLMTQIYMIRFFILPCNCGQWMACQVVNYLSID